MISERYVNIFFREERLPIEEGWTRPEKEITLETMQPIREQVIAASEWQPNDPNECTSIIFVIGSDGGFVTF
jgi:hypothetical protein